MAIYQSQPTIVQLKRALEISEQIKTLQAELAAVLAGEEDAGEKTPGKRRGRPASVKVVAPVTKRAYNVSKAPKAVKPKRTMSEEAKNKIAEAQKKRWAKQKGE